MGRYTGERALGGPVQLRPASVKISIGLLVLGWLARTLGRAVAWLVRHPSALGLAVVVVGVAQVYATYGLTTVVTAAAVMVGLLAVWYWQHPSSCRRFIIYRLRAAWRRAWVYRYGWQPAMVTCGLAASFNGHEYLPALRKVRCTGSVDLVTVRMLPGQILDHYAAAAEQLAATFKALDCRVRTGKRQGELVLWFLVRDPLAADVEPFEPTDPPDLRSLAVALREDAQVYALRLLHTHVLVGGSTGAGKGSVLWSIVYALAPGLRSGLVQLWVLDPKGGVEFAPGQRLFSRYCYGDDHPASEGERRSYELAYAEMLEAAVGVMRERQARLRGTTRLHEPTVAEPFIVLMVDELASLTAYVNDREAKYRIKAALSLLLSQGRAMAVTVVAALQDPRKDVLPFRDLFPTRIALRLTEADQVGMVLGDGARDRGARCDQIPEALPGIGYVTLDGVAEPVRLRFSFVSDEQIAHMVDTYAPTRGLWPVEGGEVA